MLTYVLIISIKYYSVTLIIIFTFSFFQGVLELLGIPTIVPRLFLEFAIIILFFKTLGKKYEKVQYKWGGWMLLIFITTIVSAIINKTSLISWLLFSRHVFIFYLMFIAIYNSNMSNKDIRKVNYWLVGLFIIQIPAAVIKLLIYGATYGRIVEGGGIGTVSVQAGSLALLITLIPISFLFSKYIYDRRFSYLIFISAFFPISFASGKRATAFVIPVLFFIIIINYLVVNKKIDIFRIIKYSFGIISISIALLYITSQTSPYLNPDGIRFGGSFDLKYMYERMVAYSVSYDFENPGAGRIPAIETTYAYVNNKGIDKVLFGFGPGEIIGSFLIKETRDVRNIHDLPYGTRSGFLWLFLQIGLLGASFYLLFIINLFRDIYHNYKVNKHNRNKAPILLGIIGCIFVFLFDFSIYSHSFITSGVMMPVLFYLSAIYLSPIIAPKLI